MSIAWTAAALDVVREIQDNGVMIEDLNKVKEAQRTRYGDQLERKMGIG